MKACAYPYSLSLGDMILGIIGFFLFTIQDYPPPTCDETTYSSAAVSALQRGTVALPILPAGSAFQRDVNAVQFGRSYEFGLAGFFGLFNVSLASARAYSVLGWFIAGGLVWVLGKECFDWRVGLGGMLLFATSTKAFYMAHLARPEAWTAMSVLLAAWIAVRLIQMEQCPLWLAFVGGVLVVWPGDFHIIGFAFTLSLTLALGLEIGLRQRRWQVLSVFGIGCWLVLACGSGRTSPAVILGSCASWGVLAFHQCNAVAALILG